MFFRNKGVKEKLIGNYQKRKFWYGNNKYQEHAEIFETEALRAGVKTGETLLEIGFGEGLFLDWARDSGFHVTGVEINPAFYQLASERGHKVFLGDANVVLEEGGEYNGIFLFDVLEHLTLEEISGLFDFFKLNLSKEGHILLRVPNGGSPFGRYLQYGDATHVTVLTSSKIQDIAQLSGMEVKGVYNGARTKRGGRHKNRVVKWLAYFMRDLLEYAIGYLYFGERIPLDLNLTVVLGHDFEDVHE